MAKPKQFPERIALHLADGTLRRLAAAAKEAGKSVPALLRWFVEYGLTRQETLSSERPKGRR